MTRILVLAGSNRAASLNRRLAAEGARILSGSETVDVARIDLVDHPLPIYDGDDEARGGVPASAARLAEQVEASDGLLLVSPEYNWSIPPLVKNALDWMSRVRTIGGRPVAPFRGLVVALASASPGQHGGIRGLAALRTVLVSLGAEVLSRQCSLARAGEAFDADGRLARDADRAALAKLLESLVDMSITLRRHA